MVIVLFPIDTIHFKVCMSKPKNYNCQVYIVILAANGDYLSLDFSATKSLVSMTKIDFHSAHLTKIVSPLLEGFPNAEVLYLQE